MVSLSHPWQRGPPLRPRIPPWGLPFGSRPRTLLSLFFHFVGVSASPRPATAFIKLCYFQHHYSTMTTFQTPMAGPSSVKLEDLDFGLSDEGFTIEEDVEVDPVLNFKAGM